MSLVADLDAILSAPGTERSVLAWLKKNPTVLLRTLAFGRYIVAEFPFGTDFRADFVALGPFSGGFDVHFVELEPPNVPLFTKNGTAAKRLAGAVTQIDSWRLFVEKNRNCVLRELSKFMKTRELIFADKSEPMDNCGRSLYHPNSSLHWSYKIIIGRRAGLSEKQIEQKASFRTHHDIEIMTYDRLLETAAKLDAYPASSN
jgi:hypothetical protein